MIGIIIGAVVGAFITRRHNIIATRAKDVAIATMTERLSASQRQVKALRRGVDLYRAHRDAMRRGSFSQTLADTRRDVEAWEREYGFGVRGQVLS